MLLSIRIKYIGHPDEILGFLGKSNFPLPIVGVEGLIISFVGIKYDIFILIGGIKRLPCLFYNFS